jgi:hypothetical protein
MRDIIVAVGVEIRDFQGASLIAYLNGVADPLPRSIWTYPRRAGRRATHRVRLVFTLAEFATALNTPDAYVIYEGHSRYGQGPAFGPAGTPHVPPVATFPVNPWGIHFRMGYEATDSEAVDDLLEHSVTPTEYVLPTASSSAFLPGVLVRAAARAQSANRRRRQGRLTPAERRNWCTVVGAWREFSSCAPALSTTTTARGDVPLRARHFFRQNVGSRGARATPPDEYLVAVEVGSADLDVSALACPVLFMASCSSHVHFYQALNRRRRAIRSKCRFYLTGQVCSANHALAFIRGVFRGYDPTSARGSRAMLRDLNGQAGAGLVGIY